MEARDGGAAPGYRWQDTASSDPADRSITITAGERVTFAYPTGSTSTTCVQRVAGANVVSAHEGLAGRSLDPNNAPPMPGLFANGIGARAGRATARSRTQGHTR